MMTISASEQVKLWLSSLPPQTKQEVRRELKALAENRCRNVLALRNELEGFHRLRVRNYRVIYQFRPGQMIWLEYADLRDFVYEAFKRLRALSELQHQE